MDTKGCRRNYGENGTKLLFETPSEGVKRENNCKLTTESTPLPNRRSYNEHMGSANFINLLDGEHKETATSEWSEVHCNIKSASAVTAPLHNGNSEGLTIGERCFCLPTPKQRRERTTPLPSPSKTLNSPTSMDQSHSIFASQTLKPYSLLNLESMEVEEARKSNSRYNLKESSPGCLPSKRRSRKLQKKLNERMAENEGVERGESDVQSEMTMSALDAKCGEKSSRPRSFLNPFKFVKFTEKFSRKKKTATGLPEFREASDSSNWETETSESSSEEARGRQEDNEENEFVFGGVRVYLDESGGCFEMDEAFGLRSSESSICSEEEQEARAARAAGSQGRQRASTKFESRDSLNLGYSGSFTA